MKYKLYPFVLFFIGVVAFGQQNITVESIYRGRFRTQDMDELQALKKSNQYTVLNYVSATQSTQIDLYDFANLQKVATLIDTQSHQGMPMVDSYSFDADEKMMLLACNSNAIYRHSFTADYYLYDLSNKQITKLFDFQIQEPTFSPDGKKIAFARDNN